MGETFDFVVAGSGGGSMCAALVMRSRGKSVLILEKTDLVGGSTAMSGGVMWIPNNRFLKLDGVEDSYEQGLKYLEAVVGTEPGSSPARKEAYLSESRDPRGTETFKKFTPRAVLRYKLDNITHCTGATRRTSRAGS